MAHTLPNLAIGTLCIINTISRALDILRLGLGVHPILHFCA